MSEPAHGVSAALAAVVVGNAGDDVPELLLETATGRVVDALAVACEGAELPVSRVARAAVDGDGPCTLLIDGSTASVGDAAFANAVAAHSTLREDVGGGGHPGTYIVPTALAVGEARRASGRDVLAAVVAGYEIAARLSRAMPHEVRARGFRDVPFVGPLASAAVVAALSGYDEERTAAALDVAANLAGGLYGAFEAGSMEGYLHAGFAARHGVLAAQLAAAGVETAPRVLEGRWGLFRTFGGVDVDPELLADAGEPGVLSALGKPFPVCALNQETMLMIAGEGLGGLAAGEIERIVLRRPLYGLNGLLAPGVSSEPPYENMLQAQMSAKFTAVAMLLGRPMVELRTYRDEYADPEVAAVAERMELVAEERSDIAIEVHLRDGRVRSASGSYAAALVPRRDTVRARFVRLATPRLGDPYETLDVLDRLDRVEDVRELMRWWRPASPHAAQAA